MLTNNKALRSAPLTQAQKMIWTGQQIDNALPIFNTAWRFDIFDTLDPDRFLAAFAAVIAKCDALRFIATSDGPDGAMTTDTGSAAGKCEYVGLLSAPDTQNWIATAISRPFDLSRESFHCALIKLSDTHWVWYLNQHHMMTDANASSVIFDAVETAYATGTAPDMPSFLTHAVAERTNTNTENAEFWEADANTVTPLPKLYDANVNGIDSASVMATHSLDAARMTRVNALLKERGFGALSRQMAVFQLFSTVLTAWMHRVSGETTIPLGVVAHGRSTLAARKTPGCFIELFPMRVDVSEGTSFRALHAHGVERFFDLLRHATPGTSTALGLNRFNTVLNVIPARFSKWAGKDIGVEWLDNRHVDQRHAFRLNVLELEDDALDLAMVFNSAVFDAAQRAAAASHFLKLLDALLENPDAAIDQVALASDDDRSSALVAQKPEDPAPLDDVISAFQALTQKDGEAVALTQGDHTFSRNALSHRMNALAQALGDAGVQPGQRVGLHLTRSVDLVASMLAALKIGASFVPFDPAQPAERLSQIENLANPHVVLSEVRLSQSWTCKATRLDVGDVTANPQTDVPAAQTTNPAYVLFTSGSTGVPKGVVISRPSLARYAKWANAAFADDTSSVWALHSAIGFDLTLTSIFAPLMSGGTIRIYPEAESGPNLSVLDVFNENAVDVVKLTPAHLRLALETGASQGRIKSLVLGGEALSTSLCTQTHSVFGSHLNIFNEYGPTEATIGCMVHKFDPANDTAPTVPIGKPADNTSIYVLDKGLNPVPDGVQGDLYIAGQDRLAIGYLDQPEQTERVFVDNPFDEGLMYKSGDLASVRRDGVVLYHGRQDDQLKLNGVRIEPAEIEAAALAVAGVEQCTVTLFDQTAAAQMLCAKCGVPHALPGTEFVSGGLCRTCAEFEDYSAKVADYFGDLDELEQIIKSRAAERTGKYDCVMLLSGGKDSTYALSRLSEITPNVLAATLDNGFISEGAKENITLITERLGIDHRFLSTPSMNEIFVDSLKRYANVCNGCFKTIYTLAFHLAKEVGAPTIVTGLSRGQLFETRLAPALFEGKTTSRDEIDDMVLEARRSYHAVPDVAATKLNCGIFDQGEVFDQVQYVDFYRYCDVAMTEMYQHLENSVGWSRPMDTGRSTNCLINDTGIHFHKKRRGYHNYALPYSWDVRLGHKQRTEAVDELQDEIDVTQVERILDEIGFDEPLEQRASKAQQVVLYFRSANNVTPQQIRTELLGALPREAVPTHIMRVDAIPLTPNGKVDQNALPAPDLAVVPQFDEVSEVDDSNLSENERKLIKIWRQVLGAPQSSAHSNFYDVGGDSLRAIQIATQANKAGLSLNPQDIFRHQTVAKLATHLPQAQPTAPLQDTSARDARRAAISAKSKSQLASLFRKKSDG